MDVAVGNVESALTQWTSRPSKQQAELVRLPYRRASLLSLEAQPEVRRDMASQLMGGRRAVTVPVTKTTLR